MNIKREDMTEEKNECEHPLRGVGTPTGVDNTIKATQLIVINNMISRLESYSMVKKVIASILLIPALTLHEISLPFAAGLLMPFIYLWVMDAYYLREVKRQKNMQYQCWDQINSGEDVFDPGHEHSILRTALTPTISLYYISLLVLVGSVLCPA